jgi:hypothetical protein
MVVYEHLMAINYPAIGRDLFDFGAARIQAPLPLVVLLTVERQSTWLRQLVNIWVGWESAESRTFAMKTTEGSRNYLSPFGLDPRSG